MQIVIIASGSGGNATLFASRGTRVLVDAGIGPLAARRALTAPGRAGAPEEIWPPDAVVITHAHSDHAGHAAIYARKLKVPVYATEATARAVSLGDSERVRLYSPREPFAIGALTLAPRPLPHDAAQVALVVSDGARRAALVTDLGEVPPGLPEHIAGCDVLLLESNHDERMLEQGPYPAHLKRRIRSARGHLSNAQTHGLLAALARRPAGMHTVVLMHLSETNNRPDLALEAAGDALGERRARLLAAPPRGPLAIDAAALPPPEPEARKRPRAMAPPQPRQLSLFPACSGLAPGAQPLR
jgi:phosphoribosyl 1,2-cyclic phosphodiesterase